jgi:tRNA-specific 2-thiouridylase
VKGRPLEEGEALTDTAVAEALGGLPARKMHCSNLAAEAIREAIRDHRRRRDGRRLAVWEVSAVDAPAHRTDDAVPSVRTRVAVAMSGGVDSSTTAALLVDQGYEVMGFAMRLWKEAKACTPSPGSCCGADAIEDARRVCDMLGIPFEVVDYEQAFKATVVDYFIAAYSRAATPNPCIACNRYIKFGLLLDYVLNLGVKYLATGNYARTERRDGTIHLLKGRDPKKDQSYVLYMLTQRELAHLVFPLGDYTKDEVRRMARDWALPVAQRPESQETCFIADNDYRRFLQEHAPDSILPGPILNTRGHIIGRHKGLPFYTIGQRTGLGIAAEQPLFVLEIDAGRNILVVGTRDELGESRLEATEVSYVSGCAPHGPVEIKAKIRYNAREAQAVLKPLGKDRARVTFAAPLRDITPGQSVVFYQGDEVLGGGTIASDRSAG